MGKLDDQAVTLAKLASILHDEIEHRSWRGAHSTARECLRASSQLEARLRAMLDMLDDGYAAAEIDRAIANGRK